MKDFDIFEDRISWINKRYDMEAFWKMVSQTLKYVESDRLRQTDNGRRLDNGRRSDSGASLR